MGAGGLGLDQFHAKSADELRRKVRAREDATRKRVSEQRNVFVSFDVDVDKPQVRLLASQAKDERFPFRFRDYSVKERIETKWKQKVAEKLEQTSAMIVAIGEHTHKSKSVAWEIEEAHKQGKKVVGVRMHSDVDHKVPAAISKHGDKVIPWNAKQIAKALE